MRLSGSETVLAVDDDPSMLDLVEEVLTPLGYKVLSAASGEEALEMAKGMALNQYMQYGISNVPDDYLENYAKEMMSKPEESRKFYEQKGEQKLIAYIKSTVKVDEKEPSASSVMEALLIFSPSISSVCTSPVS